MILIILSTKIRVVLSVHIPPLHPHHQHTDWWPTPDFLVLLALGLEQNCLAIESDKNEDSLPFAVHWSHLKQLLSSSKINHLPTMHLLYFTECPKISHLDISPCWCFPFRYINVLYCKLSLKRINLKLHLDICSLLKALFESHICLCDLAYE